MDVTASAEIGVPLDQSWRMLRDVQLVASCLPGARLLDGPDAEGGYRGQLDVQFGPTRASFAGRAELEYHDETRTVAILARGQDARGRTRAVARIAVSADGTGDGGTSLRVGGTIDVTGALERFAATGGAYLADEMMRTFAANLGTCLARTDRVPGEPIPDAPAVERPPRPVEPRPLRLGPMLLAIVRRWLRRRR